MMDTAEVAREKRHWEVCPICSCDTEIRVNRESGEYLTTLPSACQYKDGCTRRLLEHAGFGDPVNMGNPVGKAAKPE